MISGVLLIGTTASIGSKRALKGTGGSLKINYEN